MTTTNQGYYLVEAYRGYQIYFFPPSVDINGYYLVMEGWDFYQIPFASVQHARAFCDKRGDASMSK